MMVPAEGFEPPASGLQNRCSTPELRRQPERMPNKSPNASPISVQMAKENCYCQPLTRPLISAVYLAVLDSPNQMAQRRINGLGSRVQTEMAAP